MDYGSNVAIGQEQSPSVHSFEDVPNCIGSNVEDGLESNNERHKLANDVSASR